MSVPAFNDITFDKRIELIAIAISISLIILNFIFIQNEIIYLTLIVLLVFLLIYSGWSSKKVDSEPLIQSQPLAWHKTRTTCLALAFFSITTIEIILAYLNGPIRGYLLFVLYSIQIASIGLQIAWTKNAKTVALILFQIILLGLIIRFSLGLSISSVIGIDSWYHQGFVQAIVSTGGIPTDLVYSNIPVFHLLIVSGIELMGLDYVQSSFLIISTSQVILFTIFTYIIGKKLTSRDIALYAALIVVLCNTSIFYGLGLIPNSLGVMFWLPILYILLFRHDFNSRAIAISFGLILVLTHTLSSLGLFVVLLAVVTSNSILSRVSTGKWSRSSLSVLKNYPILFGSLMFTWWAYVSLSITALALLVDIGFSMDIAASARNQFIPYAMDLSMAQMVLGNIGRILYFSIAFVSVLFCVKLRSNHALLASYSLAAIIPLFLGYLSFFTGTTIISGRWWYFSQVLSAIPLALFTLTIARSTSRNYWHYVAVGIVCVLCFFMMISADANVDNNETGGNASSRLFLYDSEIVCSHYMGEHSDGPFYVDGYYQNAFQTLYGFSSEDVGNIGYDLFINERKTTNGTWVLREELKNHPVLFNGVECRLRYDAFEYAKYNQNISQIYNCGTVVMFR